MTAGRIEPELLTLVGDIYDAALDPTRWPTILDRVADAVGAKTSALMAVENLDPSQRPLVQLCTRYPEGLITEYVSEYQHYENDDFAIVRTLPAGRCEGDDIFWSDQAQFDQRPDVVFFRERVGVHRRLGVRLNDERAWFDVVTFQFENGLTPDQSHRAAVEFFWPHLAKTVSLGRGFSALKNRYGAVLQALDRYRIATFLCMPSSLVVHKNRFADELLQENPYFAIDGSGRLQLIGHENIGLADAIRRTSQTSIGSAANDPIVMRVGGRDDGSPVLLEIAPLRDADGEIDQSFRGSIVSIIDPQLHRNASTTGVKALYGLSETEAETIKLVISGLSNPEIAEVRGVSPETVKSQISTAMSKIGVRTRTELVRETLIVDLPIG